MKFLQKNFIFFLLTLLLEATAFGHFENYFLELVQDDNTEVAEDQIEQALASILRLIDIPYVGEDGSLQRKGFFRTFEAKSSMIDPEAKIYISGGVVRSMLGYIYKKVGAEVAKI